MAKPISAAFGEGEAAGHLGDETDGVAPCELPPRPPGSPSDKDVYFLRKLTHPEYSDGCGPPLIPEGTAQEPPIVFGDLLRTLADELDRRLNDLSTENGRLRHLLDKRQEPSDGLLRDAMQINGSAQRPHPEPQGHGTDMLEFVATIPGENVLVDGQENLTAGADCQFLRSATESGAEDEGVISRPIQFSEHATDDDPKGAEGDATFGLILVWRRGLMLRVQPQSYVDDSANRESSYVFKAAKVFGFRQSRETDDECPQEEAKEVTVSGKRAIDYFVMSPFCMKRMTWDIIGSLLLAYDVLMIPMGAFIVDPTAFMETFDFCTAMFWTLDIVWALFTGVFVEGTLHLDFASVWREYRKTWFLFDVLIVGQDWAWRILSWSVPDSKNSGSPAGRLFRMARMARILRLCRLVKLQRMITVIRDKVESEYFFVFVNVTRLVLVLLIINHYLAAGWWFFGDLGHEMQNRNWIEENDFFDEQIGYQYLTSLHWSLTQFTPGSMNVQPQNSGERTFAIIILIFGMVYISSFIGSISASMTQLRSLNSDTTKTFWYLRRYLREHSVPDSLGIRILRYTEHAFSTRKEQVPKQKVEALQLLSDKLHNELEFFTCYKGLMSHSALEMLGGVSDVTLYGLAGGQLEIQHWAYGERLFSYGTKACTMFFIDTGHLKYRLWRTATSNWVASDVLEKDWILEQTLFTTWKTRGEVQATRATELIAINSQKFASTVQEDARAFKAMSEYARKFVAWLNTLPSEELSDAFKDNKWRAWAFVNGKDPRDAVEKARHSRKSSFVGPDTGPSKLGFGRRSKGAHRVSSWSLEESG